MNFSSELTKWYNQNKRDLPWRHSTDPYIIWLSEIMLQQTRVEQGLPYFQKFSEKFPTIKHFAKAKEDTLLKMWQGLGYYSRVRNMHVAATEIVKNFNGKFPDQFSELKKLKGVGEYTAAAIASFAFNKPHAVVDGNVFRLLSRYFGIKTPVDSSKGKKLFFELAHELLDKKNPALHNQAIMEFGALQCKPANPDCSKCPINRNCFAFVSNKITQLPVKSKTQKIKFRYFNYFFIYSKNKLFLNKRTGNDIWKNLYEFPLIETTKKTSLKAIVKNPEWKNIFSDVPLKINLNPIECTHKLSHQTIEAKFYEIELMSVLSDHLRKKFLLKTSADLKKLGVPVLIENYLLQKKLFKKN